MGSVARILFHRGGVYRSSCRIPPVSDSEAQVSRDRSELIRGLSRARRGPTRQALVDRPSVALGDGGERRDSSGDGVFANPRD